MHTRKSEASKRVPARVVGFKSIGSDIWKLDKLNLLHEKQSRQNKIKINLVTINKKGLQFIEKW